VSDQTNPPGFWIEASDPAPAKETVFSQMIAEHRAVMLPNGRIAMRISDNRDRQWITSDPVPDQPGGIVLRLMADEEIPAEAVPMISWPPLPVRPGGSGG
jgi:hypothetical protein